MKYRSRRDFLGGKKKKKTYFLLGERANLFTLNITGGRRASERVFLKKETHFRDFLGEMRVVGGGGGGGGD